MNTTELNGRLPRKTLASQLDRLDNTIDALADGLNRSVAEAVREAVMGAVETVIREVLSRPELLRQLAGPLLSPPPPVPVVEPKPAQPSRIRRAFCWIGVRISKAWNWLVTKLQEWPATFRNKVANLRARVQNLCRKVGAVRRTAWGLRRPVALSLLIGVVIATLGYEAGPLLSSMALGVCATTMSFLAFLAAPFVRLWRCLKMQQVG